MRKYIATRVLSGLLKIIDFLLVKLSAEMSICFGIIISEMFHFRDVRM